LQWFSGVAELVRMACTKEHKRRLLYYLKLAANSWPVIDKVTRYIICMPERTDEKIWLVTSVRSTMQITM
jgi:hypothetical protein